MVLETVGSRKSNNIRSLLIRAWRERWTDMQWGIHIKTVLPRYISGDIYHLSDCILQQALMGPLPNQLIVSYLRHSLAAHIVSYGGVIDTISKYESFHKLHCVRALLDLLSSMVEKVTCRGKPEDCLALATSLVAGVKWLMRVTLHASARPTSLDQLTNLKVAIDLLYQYMQSQYLTGLLYIARLEDPTLWNQLILLASELETKLTGVDVFAELKETLVKIFLELRNPTPLKCSELSVKFNSSTTPLCHGLHARVLVEAVLHSTESSQSSASQLLLYKQLKGMTEAELYLELLSSSFLGLGSDEEFPHQDLHWVGFTFIKIPSIIKNIHISLHGTPSSPQSPSEPLLSAVRQLARRTALLDIVDHKFKCNNLELLLRELKIHTSLLLEHDISVVLQMRQEDPMAIGSGVGVNKESNANPSIIPNLIIRAEPTVSSILKTLSNKNPESVRPVMNLLISGNSRDLLLTAAAASGKLLSYAQKFVKFNQQSIEAQPGETDVMAKNRALMFDITFLLLCHIAQVYGVDVVIGEEEDTFIESWMRHHMPDKGRMKMVVPQFKNDSAALSEIMQQVRAQDLLNKYGQVNWSKVCQVAPSLMHKLITEISDGSITLQAATDLLDRMCGHLCALPICFTAWVCSYMQDINDPQVKSLVDHLQAKLSTQEPGLSLGCFRDRSLLMTEVINNMFQITRDRTMLTAPKDIPESNFFSNLVAALQGIEVEESPPPSKNDNELSEVLQQTWEQVFKKSGILTHTGLWSFQRLLCLSDYECFVSVLVKCAMENVFLADLTKAMDLVYGIFQIGLQNCCIHLLTSCLPYYLSEPGSLALHSHHRIGALSRLTVQVLVSAWTAAVNSSSGPASALPSHIVSPNQAKKRSHSIMIDDKLEEDLLRQSSTLTVDPGCLKNLNENAVALMVALQDFLFKLSQAVPKGVVNPVSEFVVCVLQEFVAAPSVIAPLLNLMPTNMLSVLLTLHPPDTFTPSQLLTLALPGPSPCLPSPLTPGQEAASRRAAAKLLCIHRNLILADACSDSYDVTGAI